MKACTCPTSPFKGVFKTRLGRGRKQVSSGRVQSARCCRCWPGPCSGGRTTTASTRGGCKEQEQGMCGSPNKDEYVAWGGAITKGMVEAGGR